MKGNDWMYLGLGVAALYAVTKLVNPIAKVEDAISGAVTGAFGGGSSNGDKTSWGDYADQTVHGTDYKKTVLDNDKKDTSQTGPFTSDFTSDLVNKLFGQDRKGAQAQNVMAPTSSMKGVSISPAQIKVNQSLFTTARSTTNTSIFTGSKEQLWLTSHA